MHVSQNAVPQSSSICDGLVLTQHNPIAESNMSTMTRWDGVLPREHKPSHHATSESTRATISTQSMLVQGPACPLCATPF